MQHHRSSPSFSDPPRPSDHAFFVPCLKGFRRQLQRYWNNRLVLGSNWTRVPIYQDFEASMMVAMRAYIHMNHGETFVSHGMASIPAYKVTQTIHALRVPRYVAAMIREISRPMTLDSHMILLPYLPLVVSDEERGQGEPGLGFKALRDSQVSAMLQAILPRDESVALEKETTPLGPSPAFICNTASTGLAIHGSHSMDDTIPFPTWRLKAISILGHVQPTCAWYKSYPQKRISTKEGAIGPQARFYRCDGEFILEACEHKEGEAGTETASREQEIVEAKGPTISDGDGAAGEIIPMPHLLYNLLVNLDADAPGYTVPIHISTVGLDVLSPFPSGGDNETENAQHQLERESWWKRR